MNQADLPLVVKPAHEAVADFRADRAHTEIRLAVIQAMGEFDERARHILAFHNRSIAQRRRFWRLRILQEKAA